MSKKSIVILLAVVLIAAIFIGYAKPFSYKVSKEILKWESQNCGGSRSCELKLVELTKFDWDAMYYFELNMNREDVSKIMNVPVEKYEGGHHTIVFIKGNKVVYTEYFPTDIEGYTENEVVFHGIRDNYGKYDSNIVFRIGKNEITSTTYYEMEPVLY